MTENEAKAIVREIIMNYAENGEEKYCEALDTAVKALEEVQQYREIDTVEGCRAAVQKQTPKRPDYTDYSNICQADGKFYPKTYVCPCCDMPYEYDGYHYDYCPNCGQKIDWRDKG